MTNVDTVKSLYEDFSRGDIESILQKLDESVEWDTKLTQNEVPWLQPRRGRSSVKGFFQAILGGLEFHKFEPRLFLSAENCVVVLINVDLTVRKTGKRIAEEDEIHIWLFNEEGKVIEFCHKMDTYMHVKAFQD